MPASSVELLIQRYRGGAIDFGTFTAGMVELATSTVRELRSNPAPSPSTVEDFWDVYGFEAELGSLTEQQVRVLQDALWSVCEPRAA